MGGTLARYAAAGEQVVVVTATRGEVGEILNHDDPDSLRESLGEVREAELRSACSLLGVTTVELLGYRTRAWRAPRERAPGASAGPTSWRRWAAWCASSGATGPRS